MTRSLDIVLVSGGLEHDGAILERRSVGGSETAAVRVAQALAARGHCVTAFSPCAGMVDRFGVRWLPIDGFPTYLATVPHDVTILSRGIEWLKFAMSSSVRVLWCHDLALKRSRGLLYGTMWALDAVFVLSPYMLKQYQQVYEGIPESLYVLTRNGVHLPSFQGLTALTRDRTKLVYGSRPERGLEQCLLVMEELARRGSPLRLEVSGYDNTVPAMAPFYESLYARARTLPNVILRGPLRQDEWYRNLATAGALIYPHVNNEFREISGLVFAEAMACGTPIVAGRKGAIPDTIGTGAAAILLGDEDTDPNSPAYVREFADALQRLHAEPQTAQAMGQAGLTRAADLSWDGVAAQWEAVFCERIAAQSADADRLRRHLVRIGEWDAVEAA